MDKAFFIDVVGANIFYGFLVLVIYIAVAAAMSELRQAGYVEHAKTLDFALQCFVVVYLAAVFVFNCWWLCWQLMD